MSENNQKPSNAAEQEPAAPKPLVPNATTVAAMKEARNLKGRFATVEELMADLKKDD